MVFKRLVKVIQLAVYFSYEHEVKPPVFGFYFSLTGGLFYFRVRVNLENLENVNDLIQKRAKIYYENNVQPKDYKNFADLFLRILKEEQNLSYAEFEAWKEVINYILNLVKQKADKLFEKKLK